MGDGLRITADIYTDDEIVENSVSARETVGLIPSVKKSSGKPHGELTDSASGADDKDAEAMPTTPTNIVSQKSAACPRLGGFSNRLDSEPRSSDSLCEKARTRSNGAGGNRASGSTQAVLSVWLDAQIRSLMELRAALN